MFPEPPIRPALSRVFARTTHVHTNDVFDDNDDDNNDNFVVVVLVLVGLDSTIDFDRPKVTTTRKFPTHSGDRVNNYRLGSPNSVSFRLETVRRSDIGRTRPSHLFK